MRVVKYNCAHLTTRTSTDSVCYKFTYTLLIIMDCGIYLIHFVLDSGSRFTLRRVKILLAMGLFVGIDHHRRLGIHQSSRSFISGVDCV